MGDHLDHILTAVVSSRDNDCQLDIRGGNSKSGIIGRNPTGVPLDVSQHRGIVDFDPGELVLTARSGTPLQEISQLLAGHSLMLPFEPPEFGGRATLGGTVACNLSGPSRPWKGAVRDAILGMMLVNGKGEHLNFGGKVMKNVAGYDASRLQAGALGTLGVITQVSLKLLPTPVSRATLAYEMSAPEALEMFNQRSAQAKPLTGAFWLDGIAYLRLAGTASAVSHTCQLWGGEQQAEDEEIWNQLNEMSLPFFAGEQPLWRVSHNPSAPCYSQFGEQLIDWGGAQRWFRGNLEQQELAQVALAAGGHASLYRGGDRTGEVNQALDPVQRRLHQRLKQSFDPDGIFNPGRMYGWS